MVIVGPIAILEPGEMLLPIGGSKVIRPSKFVNEKPLQCSNCGAPLSSPVELRCEYCGTFFMSYTRAE